MPDRITILFEKSKETLDTFLGYSFSADAVRPPHTFEFSVYSEDPNRFKPEDTLGQPVIVHMNGLLVLNGIILNHKYQNDGSVTLSGADYISQIVTGELDPKITIPEGMSLTDAIVKQASPYGFTKVVSTNDAFRNYMTGAEFEEAPAKEPSSHKLKAQRISPGENAWDFINKLAAKYGYLLQPTEQNFQLALCKPQYNQPAIHKLERNRSGIGNNILDGAPERDISQVPTYIQSVNRTGSQASTLAGNIQLANLRAFFLQEGEIQQVLGDKVWTTRTGQPPGLRDGDNIFFYRPKFITDTHCHTNEELINRNAREFAEYFRDTLTVTYTVKGHSQNGIAYAPDTIVEVQDDIGRIHQNMWVVKRVFSLSGEMPVTQLTLIRPGSYVI